MRLNSANIAGLKPGKADTIHFDDDLPGFGLRLRAAGGRTWIAQYRIDGRTRRATIGSAAVMTVTEARKAARLVLARARTGDDPQRQVKVTLRSVIGEYLAAREGKLRPRTMFEVKRYLSSPRYFGALHVMPIDRIERQHVAQQILRIERESGVATATSARSALSALFVWAMRTGIAQRNPLIGAYAPDAAPSRDRVLSDAELAAVWRACRDDGFGRIVRLLILTACRRQEVGGMSWDELDRDLWTIPGSRTKNHRTHTLPLPAAAWDIIEQVPRRADRDFLFGDRCGRGFAGWHEAKQALDKRLGDTVKPWGLHDLRRTTATRMADLGVAPHVIEAVLNHARRGVAGIYNRSAYEREMRAALALWTYHLQALV